MPVLLSVPQVDVRPDGFTWWNAIVGFGGLLAAVIAIVLARRAQRTADEAITDERRRVFELDTLRRLMRDLGDREFVRSVLVAPGTLARYSFELDLLSSRLPFWDHVIGLPAMPRVVEAVGLGDDYRSTTEARTLANQRRELLWPEFRELYERYFVDGDRSVGTRLTELDAERNALLETEQSADRRLPEILSAAEAKLAEKLAYDVHQAVLARVEARKHRRSLRDRWWYQV